MRYFYTALFYLITPVIYLRLLWRSLKQPAYRERIAERFGYYPVRLNKSIWVHAVSVGEVIAALPIINNLSTRYPDVAIVVTTMTPTGAERVRASLGDKVMHVYLPYDLPGAVQRFLRATNPMIAIMMETELWPNLFSACRAKRIPVCLMNARLSATSARGYARARKVMREMLQGLHLIAANALADAERFISLGAQAERVVVTGNVKFDLQLPADLILQGQQLRAQLGNDRFVWIAASTHVGEEEKILAAHQHLRAVVPNALLILVPRHPQRFIDVAKLCAAVFTTAKRSQAETVTQDHAVYLSDTMGELLLMYSAADVAFVGGSLIPHGGHNMLEAALLQKPLLTGPHLKNFLEIGNLFLAANALVTVQDEAELAQQLILLQQDAALRAEKGKSAYEVVVANRGALDKQINLLDDLLAVIASPALFAGRGNP